jgi:hypothetical protein
MLDPITSLPDMLENYDDDDGDDNDNDNDNDDDDDDDDDDDPESEVDEEAQEAELRTQEQILGSTEARRTFSRASIHPLTCFRGIGDMTSRFDSEAMMAQLHEEGFIDADLVRECLKSGGQGEGKAKAITGKDGTMTENLQGIVMEKLWGNSPILLFSDDGDFQEAVEESAFRPEIPHKLPRQLQLALMQQMDELCSPLASSKSLQERGLRAVLSVGMDCVVLDAALSAAMGKVLRLNPVSHRFFFSYSFIHPSILPYTRPTTFR